MIYRDFLPFNVGVFFPNQLNCTLSQEMYLLRCMLKNKKLFVRNGKDNTSRIGPKEVAAFVERF